VLLNEKIPKSARWLCLNTIPVELSRAEPSRTKL
jgi:hypothetical protein